MSKKYSKIGLGNRLIVLSETFGNAFEKPKFYDFDPETRCKKNFIARPTQ